MSNVIACPFATDTCGELDFGFESGAQGVTLRLRLLLCRDCTTAYARALVTAAGASFARAKLRAVQAERET